MLIGQGSGRNGDHYLFRPAGVPADASMFVDFVARRAWRGLAAPVAFADMFSCTRSTIGYAQGSDGVWEEFAIDEARLTDLGLLVEPARTNILTRSNDPSNSIWSNKENISVGSTVDGWTPIRETTANNFHRLFRANTTGVVGPHTHTKWIRKAGRQYLGGRVTLNGGAAYVNIGFDLDLLTTTRVPAGFTASIEKVGDVYRLVWSYTSSSTTIAGGLFTSNVPITTDTLSTFAGDTGQGFDLFNAQIEAAANGTSPIITAGSSASRSADTIPIALPAGTHDLTFTFKDGSTQVVTGQSGTPSIPAQTQPRILTSMTAVVA